MSPRSSNNSGGLALRTLSRTRISGIVPGSTVSTRNIAAWRARRICWHHRQKLSHVLLLANGVPSAGIPSSKGSAPQASRLPQRDEPEDDHSMRPSSWRWL
ncbi:hypothetical protein L226DRAFT_528457 [Lentinus tigrinus ALCF2SS1-7]|uniref:uncharacterized protein n=1 Tax=Lentinus tigrinus ALCF2SS1-7 TaxID=1328758 RepID=UPI001165ED6F|nr:hypothetical protein L226DRAFT_528457 [Lentinus tigrinus ALCF2SS1-7]